MTGLCDPDPDHLGPRPDRLELLARAAATRPLSRRQLAMLGAAAALGAILPEWAIPARARAGGFSKTTGPCPQQDRKPCDGVRVDYKPGCKRPVANGKASEFNGCGPQSGLDLPVLGHGNWVPDRPLELANFFDACKGHDCCYGTCGADKSTCDSDFLKGMMEACVSGQGAAVSTLFGGLNVATCMGVANAYYAAVHDTDTGQGAFDSGQAEVCDCCQTYTVQFDSTIDLTPANGTSGGFHLEYTAQITLSTPPDGSAHASGTAVGSYAAASGTVTGDGDVQWTAAPGPGAALNVVDFDPSALSIALFVASPEETYTITAPGASYTSLAPLWAFGFYLMENVSRTTGQVALALQPGPALSDGGPGIVATGTFDHSGDLGTADGGPPIAVTGVEHTTITVVAS